MVFSSFLIRRYRVAACSWAALFAAAAYAQPVPKLNSISKEWVQRGGTFEIALSGENFAAATNILISGERGVSGEWIATPPTPVPIESSASGISSIVPDDGKSRRIKLAVASDAPLGVREIRFGGPNGVSNPINVNVGYLPEIEETADNNSLEHAQLVSLPAIISGHVSASAQSDYFRFKASPGNPIVFDVMAARIGSPLDSSVAVLDKGGKELARNEDAKGLDSVLTFNAPAEGEYIFTIRDFRYQGAGDYRYRITAGSLPYVEHVFPFGGQRGRDATITLNGPNIDASSKLTLHLDPAAKLGQDEIRVSTAKGLSSPFLFDISDLPDFNESEPNTALDQADLVTLPVAINGRLQAENDYDAFKFHGNKDDTFIFDVIASRYGSKLDALLTLTDDRGNVLQRNDDSAGEDARIEYKFPESADYILIIEDLLHRGGDSYSYRITARRPQPNFVVRCISDTPRIRRHGRFPVRCEVTRMTGFGGVVRVEFSDLPAGIYSEPLLLTPSSPAGGMILLTCSADAPLGTFPLKLIATGEINGKMVTRGVEINEGDRRVKAGYLTVLPEAPFAVDATTLAAFIEQEQTAPVDAIVERRHGFAGEIKITVEGFSAGREPATRSFDFQPITVKGNEVSGIINLRTKLDSEIGTRAAIVRAEATVDGSTVVEYSTSFALATKELPFVLRTSLTKLAVTALPPGSQSAASEAAFTSKVERRAGFNGEVVIAVEGIPAGVTVMADKIPASGGEAPIKLVATDKAAIGKDVALTVTGTGVFNDRTYRQKAPPVTLTVNAPEAVEMKTAEVKTEVKTADAKLAKP
ncbi:MAG: hypothetical protein JWM99_1000 [Verrucomicrobiales bacterium]|nr:hypothetical protein [Verrucomicrobiales bacterium]